DAVAGNEHHLHEGFIPPPADRGRHKKTPAARIAVPPASQGGGSRSMGRVFDLLTHLATHILHLVADHRTSVLHAMAGLLRPFLRLVSPLVHKVLGLVGRVVEIAFDIIRHLAPPFLGMPGIHPAPRSNGATCVPDLGPQTRLAGPSADRKNAGIQRTPPNPGSVPCMRTSCNPSAGRRSSACVTWVKLWTSPYTSKSRR